jgi:hypothetical protein
MLNKLISKQLDIKLCIYLILGFILFTVVGTLSHELGHYVIAKFQGCNPSLHYGFVTYHCDENFQNFAPATMGGPLQTVITGSIGFILLILYRKSFLMATVLNFRQWILIFITLFWLREAFNFLGGAFIYFLRGEYPSSGDEIRLALYFDLPYLAILFPLALTAMAILTYVIFKIIPLQQRLTFMIAGLIGGLLGFYLWLVLIGPVVMP